MRMGCTCDRGAKSWGQAYSKELHCPACWLYWHNREHNLARGGDGKVHPIVKVPIQFPEQTCVYRGKPTGEIDHCHTCSGRIPVPLLSCGLFNKTCYTGNYTVTGSQACARCPKRQATNPYDPKVGVVIGGYKWPRVIEANIQLIRRTCGDVPILVNDDCSKDQEGIRRVCLRHGVDFVSTPAWMGHVGGDAFAFGNGLLWAKDRGLDVLAKMSFRVWMLRERWLQRGAVELLDSTLPIACQNGNFGTHKNFPLRSEAVMLKVDRVNPTPFFNGPFWPMNGEEVVYAAMPGTQFAPWPDLPAHRETRVGHLLTHWTHDEHEYRDVAKRLGVTLEADFHGSGWELEESRGEYKWG